MKWYEQLGMYTLLGVATYASFRVIVSIRDKIDEENGVNNYE